MSILTVLVPILEAGITDLVGMDLAAIAAFVNAASGGAVASTITRRRCLTFGAPSYRGGRAERFECACSVPTSYGSVRETAERGSSSDVPSRTCYRDGPVLLRPAVNTKAGRFIRKP